jgi:8-amino-7-oxononanoate synthase
MLNFTSALYLGLYHPMHSLRPWKQFTTGTPAALSQPPITSNVEKQLAALQGLQRATLGPSTFHLFWDLFGILAQKRIAIYLDKDAYPIAKWGVERAAAASVSVKTFRHHDADLLRRQICRTNAKRKRPVIVTDGFCPVCGKAAPLADYLTIIRRFGGYLVIDDTQALGILGHNPAQHKPYGLGGGGSLRWHDIQDPHIVNVSSMAKGFGVPLAALSGSEKFVRRFEAASDTRVHSSPASIADIHAAEHALKVNQLRGDTLRKRLARNVARFRSCLRDTGIVNQGESFPVQALPVPEKIAERIHRRLRQRGVATVLQLSCAGQTPCISFVITARHETDEIDKVIKIFARVFYEIENDACMTSAKELVLTNNIYWRT